MSDASDTPQAASQPASGPPQLPAAPPDRPEADSRPKIGDVRRVVTSALSSDDQNGSASTPLSSGHLEEDSRSDDGSPAEGRSSNKRRRGSRGGKNRRKSSPVKNGGSPGAESESFPAAGSAEEISRRPADLPDSPFEGVPSAEASAKAEVRPRRSPNRSVDGDGGEGVSEAEVADDGRSGEAGGSRSSKRRKRGQRRTPSADGAPFDGLGGGATEASEDADPPHEGPSARSQKGNEPRAPKAPRSRRGRSETTEAEAAERRRGKERNGKPLGRYLMCVHHHAKATQIATLEGRSLIEHYVSRPADLVGQIHGNIYIGRVQNVLPGMEAAFVDISTPKNAVLYRGDISFDSADVEGGSKKNNDLRIEQMLRNGQMLICQVTKNPIGSKGARLTQEVSIPGRFVVLVPNSDTYGISKRLPDEERRRLRQILDQIRPEQHGLIVRTAAEGATADELTRDVEMLLKQWAGIEEKAKKAKGPALLYREPDMAVRVIREEFNRNYRGVVIDDRQLFEEVKSYVESITPELADRVEYFDPSAEPLPLFEKHHIHEQLHKAIDRKVWLPSGGSLIIERTEALTVIDVNTGKNVGTSSLEETVFRNNLEAADEIARQLRLRDIGGIIVIDFIDMENRANREAVTTAFRNALALDKTRTQVFEISELGLVEMTRKRISEGLVESLSNSCPSCGGRGFVFDEDLVGE